MCSTCGCSANGDRRMFIDLDTSAYRRTIEIFRQVILSIEGTQKTDWRNGTNGLRCF